MAATARDLSKVPSVITLRGVNKWFGQFHVLSDINLDVKEGEKIVVCVNGFFGQRIAEQARRNAIDHVV